MTSEAVSGTAANPKQVYDTHGIHIQETSFTCGPASLLNALRLRGDHSWDEAALATLCETTDPHGTDNDVLVRAANETGLDVAAAGADATTTTIEQHLDNDHLVIVNYRHAFNNSGHYGLIVDHDDLAFYLIDSSLGLLRLKKPDLETHWQNQDGSIRRWFLALR